MLCQRFYLFDSSAALANSKENTSGNLMCIYYAIPALDMLSPLLASSTSSGTASATTTAAATIGTGARITSLLLVFTD
jgi:hypothetical protein